MRRVRICGTDRFWNNITFWRIYSLFLQRRHKFIGGLFNNAVCCSDNTSSNDNMINELKIGKGIEGIRHGLI
jgi:hypothetical protein